MENTEKIVYLYPGVHPLYAVTAFICAVIMTVLLVRLVIDRKSSKKGAQFPLFLWVLFFCIQDGVWGLFASHIISNNTLLFATSFVFHLSSAVTTLVWVVFHLSYLERQVRKATLIKGLSTLLVVVQTVMLLFNFSSKFMFYVDVNGEYTSTPYRKILFYLQFAVYIVIGIVSVVKLLKMKNMEEKRNILAASCMNISPIFFGFFQMLYPDAPANSIGFAIACIIFYTFIEADSERQLVELKARESFREIIEKQNGELKEQQLLLQEALSSAEEANKAKTAFLFNMSHDIRTPMNAITGFTTMAKKHVDDPQKTASYLDKIDIAGKQLLALINQVLEMSRIESGKIVLQEQKTNIIDFAKIIRTIYEEIAQAKGITLKVTANYVVHRDVITDSDRMKQIITNIIGNAIKYTREGGQVLFSIVEKVCDREGFGRYAFTVEDTGIGMSKEFLGHIFEEFSREETATVNKIQGTGLGMSIVKKLTDIMDGTIDIESEKGKGTKIVVAVPMRIDMEQEKEKEAEECEKISLEGLKILLADDNEMNREIATELLTDVGAEVEAVEDGEEIVDRVRRMYTKEKSEWYDVILTDIQMPKMDGYEATKQVRKLQPEGEHMVIIALSANAFAEDKKQSMESGMDDHLAKPIDVDKLLVTLMKFRKT